MKEKLEDLTYRLPNEDDYEYAHAMHEEDTLVLATLKDEDEPWVVCEAYDEVGYSTSKEMAERIVACLNFFKGIETSTVLALSRSNTLAFLVRGIASSIESNSK